MLAASIYGGGGSSADWLNITTSPYNADKTGTTLADDAFASWASEIQSTGQAGYIPAGTYKISEPLDWKIAGMSVFTDGAAVTTIKQSASNVPILEVAGQGQNIGGLTLAYEAQQSGADTAAAGIQFGDATAGSCFESKFRDLYVQQAYTGLTMNPALSSGSVSGLFSCLFENIHVLGWYQSAISLAGNAGGGNSNSTGCVFNNTYLHNNYSGSPANSNSFPVFLESWDEIVFNQLNVEHTNCYEQDDIGLAGVGNCVINGLHLEGVQMSGATGSSGYIAELGNGGNVIVNGLSVRFSTLTGSVHNPVFRFTGTGPYNANLTGVNERSDVTVSGTPAHPWADFGNVADVTVSIQGITASQVTEEYVNWGPGCQIQVGIPFPDFHLTNFGGAADGISGWYGQATSGSATFTDPTAAFTSALIGKTFTMPGMGSGGAPWTGTITAVPSATTLTISTAAGANSLVYSGTHGVMASGSANLTDSTAAFTQAWDGAIVTVTGAGASGGTLTGQMQAVSSGTSLWLCQLGNSSQSVPAQTAVSAAAYTINRGLYYIATDDSAAWSALIAAAAVAGQSCKVRWSGVSSVSTGLNVPYNVTLQGENMSPVRAVLGAPQHGSVLRAHGGSLTAGTLVTFGPGSYGYLETQVAAGARECSIDAAGVAAWAALAAGNLQHFERVDARGGTSGNWQATEGEVTWRDCISAGILEGDGLFINGANDCQWYGGFLYGSANQIHLRNCADFKMVGAHPYCGYDDVDTAVGHITVLIDTTSGGSCQNIMFSGVDFDNSYGPHVQITPAASTIISEVNFSDCQFYQNPGPYISWPNTTYPVVEVNISASGCTVSRINLDGGSAVSNWTGSIYKSVVDVTGSGGTAGTLRVAGFTATYCAALLTGGSWAHEFLSNFSCYNGTTWFQAGLPDTNASDIQPLGTAAAAGSNGLWSDSGHVHPFSGTVASAGIAPISAGWTAFGTGGFINILNESSGLGKTPGSSGEWYVAAVPILWNCQLTGICATCVSNAGSPSDKWILALWNAAGTLIANSATAGTAAPATGTKAKFAFTSAVNVTGPGIYYIGLQSNLGGTGGNAEFEAMGNATEGFVTGTISGTFGTVPSSITVPTTYTGGCGPMSNTY